MMEKLIGLDQHKKTIQTVLVVFQNQVVNYWFVPVTVLGMEYMASVDEQM